MHPFLIRTFHYFSLFTTLPVALVDIKMLTRRTVNVDRGSNKLLLSLDYTKSHVMLIESC